MEEQIEVYPYNGILFSYKKKLSTDITFMNLEHIMLT